MCEGCDSVNVFLGCPGKLNWEKYFCNLTSGMAFWLDESVLSHTTSWASCWDYGTIYLRVSGALCERAVRSLALAERSCVGLRGTAGQGGRTLSLGGATPCAAPPPPSLALSLPLLSCPVAPEEAKRRRRDLPVPGMSRSRPGSARVPPWADPRPGPLPGDTTPSPCSGPLRFLFLFVSPALAPPPRGAGALRGGSLFGAPVAGGRAGEGRLPRALP